MISIVGIDFKSEAALLKYLRFLLNEKYAEGDYVSQSDFEFLATALQRHREADRKIGVGLVAFQRRLNMFRGAMPAPGFWGIRSDGSEVKFSIYELVGKSKRKTSKHIFLDKIKDAMREAITEKMFNFKNTAFGVNPTVICPVTGKQISYHEAAVDHAGDYPFVRIQDEFLHEHGSHLRLCHIDDTGLGCVFSDPELKQFFIDFHDARAVLRVICKIANMSANSRGYKTTFAVEKLEVEG